MEELLDILEENGLKDVVVNLGHVTAYTDSCNGIANNCLNTKEYAKSDTKYQKVLFERGYKVAGAYPFYPSVKANYCCADNVGAYVIDSEGYMYKCWNDVGNVDRAVGNVTTIKDKVDEKCMQEIWNIYYGLHLNMKSVRSVAYYQYAWEDVHIKEQ